MSRLKTEKCFTEKYAYFEFDAIKMFQRHFRK